MGLIEVFDFSKLVSSKFDEGVIVKSLGHGDIGLGLITLILGGDLFLILESMNIK